MKKCTCVFLLILCTVRSSVVAQWIQMNSGLPPGPIVQALASNGSTIYAGGYGDLISPLLHRSTNNGASWTSAISGIRWRQTQYDSVWPSVRTLASSGSSVFAAAYPSLYKSALDTLPWSSIADSSVFRGCFTTIDSANLLAMAGSKLFRTTNQGVVWDSIGSSPDSRLRLMCTMDSVILAGMTDYLSAGVYRTSNLGATWQLIRTGLPDSLFVYDFLKLGSYVFVAGLSSVGSVPSPFVARSSDSGLTWTQRNNGLPNPSSVNALTSINNNVIIAGTGTFSYGGCGVYRSFNYGETWENVSGNLTSDATAIISLCVHGGFVFAGAPWTGVWRRPLSEVLPIQLASFTGIHLNGTRVLLEWRTISEVNNYGFHVMRRQENEPTFTQISPLIPGHGTTNEPQHYSWTDSNATTARWYYKLLQIDLDGTEHYTEPILVDVTTSVSEGRLPLEFRLEQNYPNPFNPTTTIKCKRPINGC